MMALGQDGRRAPVVGIPFGKNGKLAPPEDAVKGKTNSNEKLVSRVGGLVGGRAYGVGFDGVGGYAELFDARSPVILSLISPYSVAALWLPILPGLELTNCGPQHGCVRVFRVACHGVF